MDDYSYSYTSFFLTDGYQPSNGFTPDKTLFELQRITNFSEFDELKNSVSDGIELFLKKNNYKPIIDDYETFRQEKVIIRYESSANTDKLNNSFIKVGKLYEFDKYTLVLCGALIILSFIISYIKPFIIFNIA